MAIAADESDALDFGYNERVEERVSEIDLLFELFSAIARLVGLELHYVDGQAWIMESVVVERGVGWIRWNNTECRLLAMITSFPSAKGGIPCGAARIQSYSKDVSALKEFADAFSRTFPQVKVSIDPFW